MWYKKVYIVICVTFAFLTIVKGSCLEYGHSCWGAHGKRSGGPAAISGSGNLLNDGADGFLAENPNKIFFENFDDLSEIDNHRASNVDDDRMDLLTDGIKLRNFLLKRRQNFNVRHGNNNNNKNSLRDNSNESLGSRQQQQQQQQRVEQSAQMQLKKQQPQQRKQHQPDERWNKLPLFNVKGKQFVANGVAGSDDGPVYYDMK